MQLFVPSYYFQNVTHITPEFLRQKGISALVLDVDNTIALHDSQEVSDEVLGWLQKMREAGIRMMLASNNVQSRVQPLAGRLGLKFVSFSCKPSPRWFFSAVRLWGVPKTSLALVGDQIFTDALAGNLMGVTVLLVKPLAEDHKATIRLKRKLEAPFLAAYYRRGGKML